MSRSFRSKIATCLISLTPLLPLSEASASGTAEARISALARRIADHPTDKELYARRAALLCEQGDVQAAEADLSEIRRIDPGWPQAELIRARCMLDLNRLEEARENITSFRVRLPDDLDGLQVEARVLFRMEQWEEAGKRYVRYISFADRPRVEDYLEASQAFERQGEAQKEEASRVLAWGLKKLGEVPALRERYIQLALDAGDPEGALRRIDEAVTSKHKGPRQDERWLLARGDVLCMMRRFAEAKVAYRAALTTLDRKPFARRQDPEVLTLREKIEAALARVER